MHCPRCQYDNRQRATYCENCGYQLPQVIYCSQCGFENPYGATYCSRCQAPLGEAAPPAPTGVEEIFVHHHHHHDEPHSDWRLVATLSASGDDKGVELPGGGLIHQVKLRGVSGSLIINTVTVREGGEATHFPITTRFAPGQEVVKDLGREYNSTGFRVSRKGTGSVELYVQ
ncbi:MAG: hypothetical protein HYS08_00430 [Chlamydiae bacterium]|nr:hypothetical protein [Chlamydiota bacterium]MBI3266209.1 hypothetical protein [Chlamydiota bacterium]